jgi:carbonic anhydrase
MTTPRDGFVEFRRKVFPSYRFLFKRLAQGQSPQTVFITCADSRLDPCLITQSKPGDLFVIRNAGNIVPAWKEPASGEMASITFALKTLKVPRVIVCGHSDCGAMKAAIDPARAVDQAICDWLAHCREVTVHAQQENICLQRAVKENVLLQIEHLKTYPAVQQKLADGALQIEAWYYDIAVGDCEIYDTSQAKWISTFESTDADLQVSA